MFKSLIRKIAARLLQIPPPPVDERSINCEQKLVKSFQEISEGKELLIKDPAWSENLNQLCTHVLGGKDPRFFLRWDVIQNTMFVAYARYLRHELEYLKASPLWATCWQSAIQEDRVGSPISYWKYQASSGNRIHHAYHIAKFEEQVGLKIKNLKVIFEFGGGYGGMCRLIHKLGFQGKYIIFDLPMFSALTKYYLEMLGLPLANEKSHGPDDNGIHLVSDIEAIPLGDELKGVIADSLFIATWSLSECPVALRQKMLPTMNRFAAYLIAYQDHFEGVDNIEWFKQWPQPADGLKIKSWEIEHLHRKHRYLMGLRS